MFVGKLLTRSTRFTCFCTAQTSIFQKIFVKLFRIFWQNLAKIRYFFILFTDFCSDFDEILSEFHEHAPNVKNFQQFSNLFSQIRLKKRHTSLLSGICREIRTKFHQKFAEKYKIRHRKKYIIGNSFIHSRKNADDFWLKF